MANPSLRELKWKIKQFFAEEQPKSIKRKLSHGHFIIQYIEENMIDRFRRGGKGKESVDISTLEELSSDEQKWKSADANDDSEDDDSDCGDYALV